MSLPAAVPSAEQKERLQACIAGGGLVGALSDLDLELNIGLTLENMNTEVLSSRLRKLGLALDLVFSLIPRLRPGIRWRVRFRPDRGRRGSRPSRNIGLQ